MQRQHYKNSRGVLVFRCCLLVSVDAFARLAHPHLSEDAARASNAKRSNHRAASSLHSKLGEDSSSATPPTWSSTLPTLPSARAHVRTTPDSAIEGNGALTRTQRSTGLMQRRGSSTATGTGCDRYVPMCRTFERREDGSIIRAVAGGKPTGLRRAYRDIEQREIPIQHRLTRHDRHPRSRPCTR